MYLHLNLPTTKLQDKYPKTTARGRRSRQISGLHENGIQRSILPQLTETVGSDLRRPLGSSLFSSPPRRLWLFLSRPGPWLLGLAPFYRSPKSQSLMCSDISNGKNRHNSVPLVRRVRHRVTHGVGFQGECTTSLRWMMTTLCLCVKFPGIGTEHRYFIDLSQLILYIQ